MKKLYKRYVGAGAHILFFSKSLIMRPAQKKLVIDNNLALNRDY